MTENEKDSLIRALKETNAEQARIIAAWADGHQCIVAVCDTCEKFLGVRSGDVLISHGKCQGCAETMIKREHDKWFMREGIK
jgi:hypothetical protein